jgi:hypothetical protein
MPGDSLNNFELDHTTVNSDEKERRRSERAVTSLYIANRPFLWEEMPPHAEPKCLIAGRSEGGKEGRKGRRSKDRERETLTECGDDLEDCVEVVHSESPAGDTEEIFDTFGDRALDGASVDDLISNPSYPLVRG